MNATLTNGETITGASLDDVRRQMNSMLKVDGPQALTAITDNGYEIHVELWEGQDYIKNLAAATLGRLGGSSRSDAKRAASAANGRKGGRPRKQTE